MEKEKEIIGSYRNGNYTVTIYSDGSKTRETEGDAFIPSFPERVCLKISNEADGEYPWSCESKATEIKNAEIMEDIMKPKARYIRAIRPLTEVTIYGAALDHPDILGLLVYLRQKRAITRLIIGQKYFTTNYNRILGWVERRLVRNFGVILENAEDIDFKEKLKNFPEACIIATVGVFNGSDLDDLADNGFNIFIQGYQESNNLKNYIETEEKYFSHNVSWLARSIDTEIPEAFNLSTYDNIAIEQLGLGDRIKRDKDSDEFYLGSDSEFSLFIDMVDNTFSKTEYSKNKTNIEDFMTPDKMYRETRKKRIHGNKNRAQEVPQVETPQA